MKKLILFILIITAAETGRAQQNYNDFEGNKFVNFGPYTGTLDSLVMTPSPNLINSSLQCGQYIRSSALYDNFKLYPYNFLVDVAPYASDTAVVNKIQMKVYSTAPVGTFVELQLGSKSNDAYPAGVHSEYRAITTVQNAWELLTFNYLRIPVGSLVSSTGIDKIVVLLHPNSTARDTIYFDDLTGPALLAIIKVPETEALPAFKLYQNYPNPVKQNTHINFQVNSQGWISLELYDMLGRPVLSLLDQNMRTGFYSIPVETSGIPNGIYFYILKREGYSKTMKMIVLK